VLTRDDYYFAAAPAWRERLALDSGLQDHRGDLEATLRGAQARYDATAPEARVDAPRVAIQHLVEYVTCSLVIAARRLDTALISSLPALLAPFTELFPEADTLHQIALATEESLCRCQIERARARWLDVYAQLDRLDAHPLHHASFIRNAVAYALGVCEASLGMQTARHWADQLDDDPLQAGSAMYLRKVLRMQLGDFEGAERFRRKAELLSIHSDASQIFSNTIVTELAVHAIACDLLGVKQLADRIAPLAARCPGWVPYQDLAAGYFERLRGNPTAALQAFERCLDRASPRDGSQFTQHAWPLATAGLAEALIDLGHHSQAARLARAALDRCQSTGVHAMARMITRALALAEAKLGQCELANERLDAAIALTQDTGVTGLQLGCLYEARAFVAIEAGDQEAVERYTRLTAREYRYGLGSPLGARCERLIEAAGLEPTAFLQPLAAWSKGPIKVQHGIVLSAQLGSEVSRAMAGAELAEGRAQRALRLLCDSQGANAGHLYLATSTGLVLAASHGTVAPDEALRDLARERLESDMRHQVEVTRVDGDTSSRFEHYTRAVWTDPLGQPFEPRILHCVQNGSPRCAGVAMLAQTPAPRRATRSAQFATALSAYLIDVGETPGV
jgi:tetratricopeptide (TPR) repeat protein